MKVNLKLTVLTSIVAFVLSFFTALISKAGFGWSLLRGLICAVVFGGISVGITFLYNKFLSDKSSNDSSSDDQENPAPIGNKVDITIDDAELSEEENTPKFVLTGQNQMLNKDDLSSSSAAQLDNINEEPGSNISQPVSQPLTSGASAETVRKESPVPSSHAVSSEESAPSFKPVALGKVPDNDTDELPAIETSLGDGSFLKQGGDESEDTLDVLPDMGTSSKVHDDTVTDSDFANGGKNTSRLSDPMFPDGSMAESKDAALMAEALRTVLKKGE